MVYLTGVGAYSVMTYLVDYRFVIHQFVLTFVKQIFCDCVNERKWYCLESKQDQNTSCSTCVFMYVINVQTQRWQPETSSVCQRR